MRKQLGFTLVELIVVIFIIGLVAGALIYNFRTGDKQKRVNLARDTMITALRTAQNYALSGRQIPPTSEAPYVRGPARCNNTNAAISYWVEFARNSNTFTLMAEDTCHSVMAIQSYNLISRTQFVAAPFSLDTGAGASTRNDMAIRFTPPFGAMTASTTAAPTYTSFTPFVAGTVTAEFIDGSRSTTVTANGISGKID